MLSLHNDFSINFFDMFIEKRFREISNSKDISITKDVHDNNAMPIIEHKKA